MTAPAASRTNPGFYWARLPGEACWTHVALPLVETTDDGTEYTWRLFVRLLNFHLVDKFPAEIAAVEGGTLGKDFILGPRIPWPSPVPVVE